MRERENVRKGTFVRDKGTFARGDLQGHRIFELSLSTFLTLFSSFKTYLKMQYVPCVFTNQNENFQYDRDRT